MRGGAYVRPAITPDQTGTTNYLDNFTENFSAGATFSFDDPLRVFTEPVHFDISAGLLVANERDVTKSAGGGSRPATTFARRKHLCHSRLARWSGISISDIYIYIILYIV